MRWEYVFNLVGILMIILGLSMLLPLCCGIYYHDDSIFPLLKSIGITTILGLFLFFICKNPKTEFISQREGMAIVSVGWIVSSIIGALPFYFSHSFINFTDALFESISGFTTTGSSILTDIESVPPGILLWRSLIQWLGGMGIIVLSVAIIPFLGIGGMQLYKAEVPSPVPDKLKPRIQDTAMIMWKVYFLFTVIQIILLLVGGMSLFDSVNHAFTTMPTGGFSIKNASIAHYNSSYFDWVFVLFMIIAGINFSLHYQLLSGNTLAFWRDPECRFYVGVVIVLTIIVTLNIYKSVYSQFDKSFRYAAFQIVSILTTTGYATADYEQWPAMSQIILLICMFLGASAGSTGGGMKCIRIIVTFKYCYKELFSLIHPHAVTHIKLGGKSIPEDVVRSILCFLSLYMMIFVGSAILLAYLGVDFITSFGAVAATLGNIGPGFGTVGPVENFSTLPVVAKWILMLCMLLGRLEIFTMIVLFVPEFWRK